jgi:hypothetical protein
MKNSVGKRAASVAGAAGLLVLALCIWKGQKPAAPELSPGPTQARTITRRARSSTPMPAVPWPSSVRAQARSSAGDVPPGDDYEDNILGDLLEIVLKDDKELDRYMYYHNRPLLDAPSRLQYQKLLSDPEMLAHVQEDLLYPEEKKETRVGDLKRLIDIDYLRDALDWSENPMRDTVLSHVSDILLTDNFPEDMGMDMRVSLAGNKMELYELLYDNAPERADTVVQASKGTRIEAMLTYIADALQTRRQIESHLESQITL